ncbi:MAG: hypothetical protein WBA93_30490 [Microcoleaceae cyanobacterium]
MATGLAVSVPVAYGEIPFGGAGKSLGATIRQKKIGLGGKCYVSAAPLQEAAESPYPRC